jgi:hypothetical protein
MSKKFVPSPIASLPIIENPGMTIMPTPKPPKDPSKMLRVGVFVHPTVHRLLRNMSVEDGISLSQMFNAGIDMYLASRGKPSVAELIGQDGKKGRGA